MSARVLSNQTDKQDDSNYLSTQIHFSDFKRIAIVGLLFVCFFLWKPTGLLGEEIDRLDQFLARFIRGDRINGYVNILSPWFLLPSSDKDVH